MVLSAVLQISTVLAAVLTLVWHQTRTLDRLRKEVRSDHSHLLKLHTKAARQARKDNEKLRREFTKANNKLWDAIVQNSQKLDRIGGFLGIGMAELAAGRAPGAALGVSHTRREDPSAATEDEPQERRPEDPLSEADEGE